jgi:hypothetical protein
VIFGRRLSLRLAESILDSPAFPETENPKPNNLQVALLELQMHIIQSELARQGQLTGK